MDEEELDRDTHLLLSSTYLSDILDGSNVHFIPKAQVTITY